MNWISPLVKPPRKAAKLPNRKIVINGVYYPSIYRAQKALRCSGSKIYRLIGESWRYCR